MKTKIYVLKLKQIIKVCVVGIIMIVLALFLVGLLTSKPTYSPGTYSAQIVLHNSPVSVDVTVSKHQIEGIALNNMNSTQEVFYPLFNSSIEEITDEIIANQTTDIPLSQNNSVTGGIILDAVRMALEQAKN